MGDFQEPDYSEEEEMRIFEEVFEPWKESAHVEDLMEQYQWDDEIDEVYTDIENALVSIIGRYSLVGDILTAYFAQNNAEHILFRQDFVEEGEQGEDANVRE